MSLTTAPVLGDTPPNMKNFAGQEGDPREGLDGDLSRSVQLTKGTHYDHPCRTFGRPRDANPLGMWLVKAKG